MNGSLRASAESVCEGLCAGRSAPPPVLEEPCVEICVRGLKVTVRCGRVAGAGRDVDPVAFAAVGESRRLKRGDVSDVRVAIMLLL